MSPPRPEFGTHQSRLNKRTVPWPLLLPERVPVSPGVRKGQALRPEFQETEGPLPRPW